MAEMEQKRRGVLPSTLVAIGTLASEGVEIKAWPFDENHDILAMKRGDKVVKLKLGEDKITEISGLDATEVLDPKL